MKTRIFSCGGPTTAQELLRNTDAEVDSWFPELTQSGTIFPLNHSQLRSLLPKLIGKTIVTLSEIIILTFLREVRKGRMKPTGLELYCDSRQIRIGVNGDMLDYWGGHFFETGYNLRFH